VAGEGGVVGSIEEIYGVDGGFSKRYLSQGEGLELQKGQRCACVGR
jgi:hypothetical protein